jgi:hypothetical protein
MNATEGINAAANLPNIRLLTVGNRKTCAAPVAVGLHRAIHLGESHSGLALLTTSRSMQLASVCPVSSAVQARSLPLPDEWTTHTHAVTAAQDANIAHKWARASPANVGLGLDVMGGIGGGYSATCWCVTHSPSVCFSTSCGACLSPFYLYLSVRVHVCTCACVLACVTPVAAADELDLHFPALTINYCCRTGCTVWNSTKR